MTDESKTKTPKSGWLNLVIDYAPLVVFLLVYYLYSPEDKNDTFGVISAVVRGTGAFMVAAIAALIASKFYLGHISRMLMLSTFLIVGFGGLTVVLADPFWVQVKPTALYAFFGLTLLAGWWRGKALLQWLLDAAFEGLNKEGWLKLSRNWGIFFLALALLNEAIRHFYNVESGGFDTWLWAKFWVFMPLTFLFTFTQIPMLLKHGMSLGDEEEVLQNPPHE